MQHSLGFFGKVHHRSQTQNIGIPGDFHSDPGRRALHFACFRKIQHKWLLRLCLDNTLSNRNSQLLTWADVQRCSLIRKSVVLCWWQYCLPEMRDTMLLKEENLRTSGIYKPQISELTFTCWYWTTAVLGWKVQPWCERGRTSTTGRVSECPKPLESKTPGLYTSWSLGQNWKKRYKPALPWDVFFFIMISTVFIKQSQQWKGW